MGGTFFMGMSVYRDGKSRLAVNLFSVFIFLILMRSHQNFFKYEGLIGPNRGINILVTCIAMLLGGACLYQI